MKITGTILSSPTSMDGCTAIFLLKKDEKTEYDNLFFCIYEGSAEERTKIKLHEGAKIRADGKLTICISREKDGTKKISRIFNISRLV